MENAAWKKYIVEDSIGRELEERIRSTSWADLAASLADELNDTFYNVGDGAWHLDTALEHPMVRALACMAPLSEHPLISRRIARRSRKPIKCPSCRGSSVWPYLRGMPSSPPESGWLIGGCCLAEDMPEWGCPDCGLKIHGKLRVFLDDERETPFEFTRVYWPADAIALLQTGCVGEMSLDHDLGDDSRGTGYDVVLWIEEAVATRGFRPPKILVHSANSSARQKMEAGIRKIKELDTMNRRERKSITR